MKYIYIKEESLIDFATKRLLPKFLFNAVKNHMTSLGDNRAFPNGDVYPFDYVII